MSRPGHFRQPPASRSRIIRILHAAVPADGIPQSFHDFSQPEERHGQTSGFPCISRQYEIHIKRCLYHFALGNRKTCAIRNKGVRGCSESAEVFCKWSGRHLRSSDGGFFYPGFPPGIGRCESSVVSKVSPLTPRRGIRPSAEQWLWIFDFDGTLSPIVPDRNAATMDPACRRLLSDLLRAGHRVAILSSRSLDDLYPRIGIPGVYAGGGMGVEWMLPAGEWHSYAETFSGDVAVKRDAASAGMERIGRTLGVDVEDKYWTVSFHVRGLKEEQKEEVRRELSTLADLQGLRIRSAPEAFEVLFSPMLDKSFGVSVLCRIVNWDTRQGRLVYAGDDENDAVAMELVAHLGGVTISVARSPAVRDTILARDPAHLASVCRRMAGLK